MSLKAPWITYRPELKVLDCTIRDGGLVNDHQFDDALVKAVYKTCVEAGIDYMEIGYKNSQRLFAKDQFGAWKHCDEDDMRRIVDDNPTDLKLSAMADAGKSDYKTDILPKEQSVLDVIRVACYVYQIPEAVDMIKDAADKGYEVTCNIMAVSTSQEAELDQALEVLRDTPASTVVVVDSNGALYAEQVEMLDVVAERVPSNVAHERGLFHVAGRQAHHGAVVLEHLAERVPRRRQMDRFAPAAIQDDRDSALAAQSTALGRTEQFTSFDGQIDDLHGWLRRKPRSVQGVLRGGKILCGDGRETVRRTGLRFAVHRLRSEQP